MTETNRPRRDDEYWEQMKVQGGMLADKVRELIHEGNVRHVIIKHGDSTILEIPVGLGVAAVVLAPTLAAVAAVGAVVTQCTIDVVRSR